jgi:hypothetical protein
MRGELPLGRPNVRGGPYLAAPARLLVAFGALRAALPRSSHQRIRAVGTTTGFRTHISGSAWFRLVPLSIVWGSGEALDHYAVLQLRRLAT